MAASIELFRLPRYRDIPDVGLYLDQTVKYINRFLLPLGCVEITSSMVSNYVKKGYIRSPERKQYNAEQIASLFFIAIAKSVLTMEHIARLFEMQRATYSAEIAYDYFCDELENMLHFIVGLKDDLDQLGSGDSSEAKSMLHSTITAVAHIIYLNSQFEALASGAADEGNKR